jgi:hypothetical protein
MAGKAKFVEQLSEALVVWISTPPKERTVAHFGAIHNAFEAFDQRNRAAVAAATGAAAADPKSTSFFEQVSEAAKITGNLALSHAAIEFPLCLWLALRLEQEVYVVNDSHVAKSLQDAVLVAIVLPITKLTDPPLDASGVRPFSMANSALVAAMVDSK